MLYVNFRFTSTLKSRTEIKDRSRNDRALERIARKPKYYTSIAFNELPDELCDYRKVAR
ncbi:4-oxalocrotonate tautomerase [Candidatus Nitrotoga sp. M5]|uniref:4-oxalocrotonate tautomerase n=1 Tax=Candidatus Nitrotoga sp. M5 TaxID=2890409 RepID=UPI001EF1FC3B|nr:4-oxalocrotonate tautomerase [Candidatus Nitrotoga sp. M5]CAH1386900.1 4-oxalocrotonate tautomerase [Candidatus Nitrotoga sp. M5]